MHFLFLDAESYYDDEYSLRKMSPANYILDPRFEFIGCAARLDDEASHWVDAPDFPKYLAQFDPADITTVCFNALFDNCIFAWHYGFVPARMLCTMRMAVALRGHKLRGASLASVGACLGVGVKGTAIDNARGKHRLDLMASPGGWRDYTDYAINDNEMNAGILLKLWPEFPASERRVMDKVIRCAVCPQFMVDRRMLADHMDDLELDKAKKLAAAGITDPKELRSNDKFAALLAAHGVDVEMKVSATDPSRMIPAFAKTDQFMADLLEHDDPDVQALAAARLGERSTIEQKRGMRILSIASLPWAVTKSPSPGTMPIPLRFCGAHTWRLSGDWLLNMQNLPSGRVNPSKLRKSLKAPKGHKAVKADKAQIECRINAYICGQNDLLDIFRRGGDPYSVLASAIFGIVVDKNTDGGIPRFIGKSGELGLGFGCGDEKFFNMVVRAARGLGMDVKKLLLTWTPSLASRSVHTYRRTHNSIVRTWEVLQQHLKTAWLGLSKPIKFGPVVIGHGYVEGPGGLKMVYANPREDESGELLYDYGKRTHRLYGPKFLENIVQFLARINLMNDALRIYDRTKIDFAIQEHDALAWIVPDDKVDWFKGIVREEMTRCPSWAPGIPLGAEISHGDSYGG